jgi:hypothetical protein
MVLKGCALVVELVDTLVLGTSSASCSGSSPDEGTTSFKLSYRKHCHRARGSPIRVHRFLGSCESSG